MVSFLVDKVLRSHKDCAIVSTVGLQLIPFLRDFLLDDAILFDTWFTHQSTPVIATLSSQEVIIHCSVLLISLER